MATSIGSLLLLLSVSATGGLFDRAHRPTGRIIDDGPGYGWGFVNGNPDGYGWFDSSGSIPLGANNVSEFHFPRYLAVPANQLFFPQYYNAYTTRGQRFLPYVGCGGEHPAGGPPPVSGDTPVHPYNLTLGSGPARTLPPFTGRVEAPPINPGQSGLRP